MTIGHPTATDIGRGVRHSAGPGLDMNHGVGPRITMDVGSTTTADGLGVLVASFTGTIVGGVAPWWRSFTSISVGVVTAGIRSTITSAIHTLVITQKTLPA